MEEKEVTLQIEDMSCASGVQTIEGALHNLGVRRAAVNFAAKKAAIRYDPALLSLDGIRKAIADVGYTVAQEEVTLKVTGMSCTSCVHKIETALKGMEGVIQAAVSLPAEMARVVYL